MSSPSASQPEEVDASAVHSLLREACAEALPNWLEKRRWFADKGRGISGVAIEDALDRARRVGLACAGGGAGRVHRREHGPLSLAAGVDRVSRSRRCHPPGQRSGAVTGVIVDATEKPWFGGWLLDQFAGATELARGALDLCRPPGGRRRDRVRSQQSADGRARGAEQLVIALRRHLDRQALPAAATGPESRRRGLARAG